MTTEIQKNTQLRMTKSVQSLEAALAKLRAGRAHPSLLSSVCVPYYGSSAPLSQVASVNVEGALMLVVKPWEKQLVPEIEKAIRSADLGLNPATVGDVIRVPLPPLSEERRKELIKKVKVEAEDAKVAIRNIRRDSNHELKEQLKEKLIREDACHKSEEDIQKLTDASIRKIEDIVAAKEKDLLSI